MRRMIAALFFLGFLVSASGQEVTIGGFPSIAPYALIQRSDGKDKVVGGIIKEIADEVARLTGYSFRYYFPPRARMEQEVARGNLDVLPLSRPEWFGHPEDFTWSAPVFAEKMVFVTLKDKLGRIQTSTDLAGVRLGMISGYLYPELPPSWGYRRDDAQTLARNFRRLEASWIDALYGGDIEIGYRTRENRGLYAIQPYSPRATEYHWALSTRLGPKGDAIAKALATLVSQGKVAAILAKYR